MKRLYASMSVVVIAVMSFTATSVQATVITKNGAEVFNSGGFEDDAADALPSAASPGSWRAFEPIYYGHPDWPDSNQVRVKTSGSSGVPAAPYGDKVLEMYKPNVGTTNSAANAIFGSTTSGDVLNVKYDIYVDSNGNTKTGGDGLHAMSSFVTSDTEDWNGYWASHYTWMGYAFQGGDIAATVDKTGIGAHDLIVASYNGSYDNLTRLDTGANMYMSPDAWHSVEVNLTVGTGYTLSIDGVASNPVALESGIVGTPKGFIFHNNVNNDNALFYVDGVSVPEPSALTMALAGVAGLLAYAWRRQR